MDDPEHHKRVLPEWMQPLTKEDFVREKSILYDLEPSRVEFFIQKQKDDSKKRYKQFIIDHPFVTARTKESARVTLDMDTVDEMVEVLEDVIQLRPIRIEGAVQDEGKWLSRETEKAIRLYIEEKCNGKDLSEVGSRLLGWSYGCSESHNFILYITRSNALCSNMHYPNKKKQILTSKIEFIFI